MRQPLALDVECPVCHADAGSVCVRRSGDAGPKLHGQRWAYAGGARRNRRSAAREANPNGRVTTRRMTDDERQRMT